MDDTNKTHFGIQINHFGVVHQKLVSRELLRAYWDDLKHLTLAEFDTAVAHLKRHAQWFPKPAEFCAARRAGWL